MHNPLRSEAEMFRFAMVVAAAAAPVIALALITRPLYGAILLALEMGAGIGLMWRGARGSLPSTTDVAPADDDT
jgi:hypothetical protein